MWCWALAMMTVFVRLLHSYFVKNKLGLSVLYIGKIVRNHVKIHLDSPLHLLRLRVPTEFWNWGYNCCFFLNFVPLHIESPYNFGGTEPILGVKNPLQRVNGHADISSIIYFKNLNTVKPDYLHLIISYFLGQI